MKHILLILLFLPAFSDGQIITTVAGNGTFTNNGDGGPATAAAIGIPDEVAWDKAWNLYIGEGSGNKIRKVSTSGIISTIAGNGTAGYGGDGGPATAAMINTSMGVAVDTAGNVYISDVNNNRIRKVTSSGIISTYGGTGVTGSGPNGDGGPATAATLSGPIGGVLDKAGNLYVSDANWRVRKISTSGIITTVVGNGINGFSGDGGPATAAMISRVRGIAFDETGNMYITDQTNDRVRMVNTSGIISTIAGTGLIGYNGDGGAATAATFAGLTGILIDNLGNIIIGDYSNWAVRMISTSGTITTVAGYGTQGYSGDGGPATAAKFYGPNGLGVDSCNNLYICDMQNGRVRKVTYPVCSSYPLAVSNITAKQSLSIYPNPANSLLTIAASERITTVTISDIIGRTICVQRCDSQQVHVNVTDLPKGIYFIRVNGSEVRKFVKE